MAVQPINLQLPAALHQRLVEVADASQQSLAEVIIQSIQTGLPPGLEHIPERFQYNLRTLNQLSDEMLWEISTHDLTDDKVQFYEQLLVKNQQGLLTENEQHTLGTLREESDLLMLRRAYATGVLKWRGHSIPTLADLQTP